MNFKLGNDDITLKYEYTLGWVIMYLLFLFIYLKTSKEKKNKENLIKFYNVKGIFYSARKNKINVNILIIHWKTTQYCLRGPWNSIFVTTSILIYIDLFNCIIKFYQITNNWRVTPLANFLLQGEFKIE